MALQLPGILRSWLKQEGQALANPGWRTLLKIATPLLLGLLLLEAVRRLQERSEQLMNTQQQAIDLLHWLAEEQHKIALDWGHWDDALAYAEGRNPLFPVTDMETTALLDSGAVMAIWGPTGQLLVSRGGSADGDGTDPALLRCLDNVNTRRRSSGAAQLNVLCAGGNQLYVGALVAMSDSTSTQASAASLTYMVPLITTNSRKPLAASLRSLRSQLVLPGVVNGGSGRARTLAPPLWTSGGQRAGILPPGTIGDTLSALLPLAGLTAASAALLVGLRLRWMLGVRRQQLQACRAQLAHGRRIRTMQREIGEMLEQMHGQERPDQLGAFARLLHQQNATGPAADRAATAASESTLRPQERLVHRLESLLTNARRLVLNDGLTGLPNRSYFLQQLTWESDQCRSLGIPLALLFINIDRFKRINETYGHTAGDLVLQHVASELRQLIEPSDFLARFGGDEFGLILNTSGRPDASESALRDLAHQRALHLLKQFNSHVQLAPEQLNVSLSIGIALSDLNGSTPEELIRRSDQAMAVAKQQRTTSISVFDLHCDAQQLPDYRLFSALESDLNDAPEHLQIVFQPIVDLDGSVLEVEALARWRNPQFPATSPDQFMVLAERYRLIDRLGKLLLEKSLIGFSQLRQGLPQGATIRLAINISPSQLLHDGFGTWLLEQLSRRQIPASAITLEVTESAVIETTDDLTRNLANLRQAGMRLALDDFGTGFSSLRLLMILRPDELKIDKSFVSATLNDALALRIVLLLQQLSETMGLTLVAEGVEDERTRDRLVEAGVRCFQGYLYARPAGAAELIANARTTAPRAAEPGP
jgi:diguanylate cyclase (GGDEF)-like protein